MNLANKMASFGLIAIFLGSIFLNVSGKHIVIVTLCDSHFYLTENIAQGLVAKNHRVTFVLNGKCTERVRKTGAEIFSESVWETKEDIMINLPGYIRENNELAGEQLLTLIKQAILPKPDLIMADFFVLGTSGIADKYGIPFANMYFGMVDYPGYSKVRNSLNAFIGIDDNKTPLHRFASDSIYQVLLNSFFNVIKDSGNDIRSSLGMYKIFTSYSHLLLSHPTFVLLSPKFQESFDTKNVYPLGLINQPYDLPPLPKNIQNFVDKSSKDILYVAFGSTMVPSETIQRELMSFLSEQTDYDVIYARFPDIGLKIPDNVLTEKFIPQRTLLNNPKVKVFISHCGLNSFIEAFEAEKVVICLPLGRDQYASAFGVVKAGVAEQITNGNSRDSIALAVGNARQNYQNIYSNIKKEKQKLYDIDGVKQIENLIEKYSGKSTLINAEDPYTYAHIAGVSVILLTAASPILLLVYFLLKLLFKSCFKKKEKTN